MADFEVKFSEINKSFKLIESGSEGDSGTGLTDAAKQAMLQIARKVAYIDEHGQTYYDDLYDALYGITAVKLNRTSLVMAAIGSTSQLIATTTPAGGTVTWASSDTSVATVDSTGLVTSVALGSCTITATAGRITATCAVSIVEATLVSIDAVYTQSGTVYDTADLDDLKTDLVVTASWSSGTTSEVSSSDYALSGTLTVGTSTVTVTYGECTDTFTVNVTAAPTLTSISAVYTQSGTVYDTDTLDSLKSDLVVTAHYSDQTSETVTTYTLSGTLAEGTSTITVSYGGKTTTFNVTVSQDVNFEVLSFGTCISGNNTSIRFNGTTFEDQAASNEWQVKSTIAASRISIVWDSTEADAFQITIGQRDANGDPYKVSNLNRYSSNPVTDGSAFTSSTWKDPSALVWTAISGGNIEITLPTTGLVLVAARRSSGTGEASTNARMATWLTDSGLTITAYK